jgi:hypothetical protein
MQRFPTAHMLAIATITTLAGTATLGGCDMVNLTVNTTAKVLVRAKPSLNMESDYELASRAIPGTLKTIEGFHIANPENRALIALLAEAYCQYGTAFVEDEWERAELENRYEDVDYHSKRASRMFIRCTNYGLDLLGKSWRDNIYGDFDKIKAMIDDVGVDHRDALMWTAVGLASTINQNKDNVSLIAQLPTAVAMLQRVVVIDDKTNNRNLPYRALPHIALGMFYSGMGEALGGDSKKAKAEFERALKLTDNKFLLARTLMARRIGVMKQDRDFFRAELLKVLKTNPAIWPEQRLANEIAHRRARRYLKYEKEWF